MSGQQRCCLCGWNRFRRVTEARVEIFAWTENGTEYLGEQRAPGTEAVSSYFCERCGTGTPISPSKWTTSSQPASSRAAEGERSEDVESYSSDERRGISHGANVLYSEPRSRRIP